MFFEALKQNPKFVNDFTKMRLSAGGKPSTMVTARKTCKARHFEKKEMCAQFV